MIALTGKALLVCLLVRESRIDLSRTERDSP